MFYSLLDYLTMNDNKLLPTFLDYRKTNFWQHFRRTSFVCEILFLLFLLKINISFSLAVLHVAEIIRLLILFRYSTGGSNLTVAPEMYF